MGDRIDLAAIRARVAAATPGPWRSGSVEAEGKVWVPYSGALEGPSGERCLLNMNTAFPHTADRDLIAHAPTDLAALCDKVERLRASNERLRHVVELDEAIYLDLARAAGFDHEPPSDARACIAAVKAMATERDALRESIAGRTTGPTRAEQDAHDERGGYWMIEQRGLRLGRLLVCSSSALRFHLREIEAVGGSLLRVWSLDASGAPCAWPVVTEVSRG